jgi:hypothetical protein
MSRQFLLRPIKAVSRLKTNGFNLKKHLNRKDAKNAKVNQSVVFSVVPFGICS